MPDAELVRSVCPHDCPSTCALLVERLPGGRVGKVRGHPDQPFTEGVICNKVARYGERVHHPERVLHPLRRVGPKGSGRFARIAWDEALDEIADRFATAAAERGPEAVWPYLYGGTLGLVQRNAVERLRRVMGWSEQKRTICTAIAAAGWMAGVGAKWGSDPTEMAEADLIVLWGTNAVATQLGVMHWAGKAKLRRGARIVVIDPYRTPTAAKADLHLPLRPGTDAALACAVMHVLLKEGLADRDFLARLTDFDAGIEEHLAARGPGWAAAITGLPAADIEAFARLYGGTRRSYIRAGYGFTRHRNGAAAMHAVSCLPAVTGAWRERGGGALWAMSDLYHLERSVFDAGDRRDPSVRVLDMCRIGPILTGEAPELGDGPPVTAMLVQCSNPAAVAPDLEAVRRGFLREDMFLAVHEQFLTDTAKRADIVLPATTFLEHDDLYTAGGHRFLQVARAVVPPQGEARSNHEVVAALARRLGAEHETFAMTAWEIIDRGLRGAGQPGADALEGIGWHDCGRNFETMHFLEGFGHPDGRFRFRPDWAALGPDGHRMPPLVDHMAVAEDRDAGHPFRLVAPPSRHFLNTSFTENPVLRRMAGRPTALVHPDVCARMGLAAGDLVRIGNHRASVVVNVEPAAGQHPDTVVVEGTWPAECFVEGGGINRLVGAEPASPNGGGAFHDTAVWLRPER